MWLRNIFETGTGRECCPASQGRGHLGLGPAVDSHPGVSHLRARKLLPAPSAPCIWEPQKQPWAARWAPGWVHGWCSAIRAPATSGQVPQALSQRCETSSLSPRGPAPADPGDVMVRQAGMQPWGHGRWPGPVMSVLQEAVRMGVGPWSSHSGTGGAGCAAARFLQRLPQPQCGKVSARVPPTLDDALQLSGRAEARSSPVAWLDVTHTCQRLRDIVSCMYTWQALHAPQWLSLCRRGQEQPVFLNRYEGGGCREGEELFPDPHPRRPLYLCWSQYCSLESGEQGLEECSELRDQCGPSGEL